MKYIKNIIKDEINEHKEAVKELNKNKIKIERTTNLQKTFFVLLVSFYIWQYFFDVSLFTYTIDTLKITPLTYIATFDLITLAISIALFSNEIKKAFINFKNNIKNYIEYFMLTLVVFLSIDLLVGELCNYIVGSIPENQSAIMSISNKIYLVFGSCIYAPFVEEIIFRGILRKFIKNKYIFIIISAILFGLMHVVGTNNIIQYVYVLYYGLSGAYFAYMYTKFDNLFLSIFGHFFINFFATLSMLLIH